ncbi:TerD family protein [Streptacidiphilus sp. PB12-B1b]|uniref:TerD family protein n=1 Tax=Streptacidiphilus sp. PB12-B1b TaxID=2705012 RepID=UPI0015F84F63|nr:TerD family protein [Streptacidiphilus sp. PB12-B1b]QMU78576.1 TerD family protein [Streptacidiphilus sp. PB12-B1b]
MSAVLTPGGNTPLTSGRVTVEVAAAKALDVSALLVTASGKVRSDDDFVFFNAPEGPGVHYSASGITVDTAQVPPGIDKVVVTASLDDPAATFAGTEPTATVRDSATGEPLASFTPPRLGPETALIVVELYRRGEQWKLRAVGQGYADGLAGIATDFGVSVDDPGPAAAPATHAAQPAPAAPAPAQPVAAQAPAAPYAPPAAPAPVQTPGSPVYGNPPYQAPAQPPAPPSPYQNLPYQPPAQPPAQPGAYPNPPVSQGWIPASVPAAQPQSQPQLPAEPDSWQLAQPAPAAATPPPTAAAPADTGGRVTLDKGRVSLTKGSSVSLVKNGQPLLTSVRMGLGWEPAFGGRSVDLDASVIAYDKHRKELDKVWFMNLKAFDASIQHAGDNLTGAGAGDDEAITVHLQSLPAKVTALVFTVNSYSGQRFTEVAKAYCRLLDATSGAELVRFDLTHAEPHTGVLMCKLVKMRSGEWVMTALEEYVDSKTVRGMVKAGADALR